LLKKFRIAVISCCFNCNTISAASKYNNKNKNNNNNLEKRSWRHLRQARTTLTACRTLAQLPLQPVAGCELTNEYTNERINQQQTRRIAIPHGGANNNNNNMSTL